MKYAKTVGAGGRRSTANQKRNSAGWLPNVEWCVCRMGIDVILLFCTHHFGCCKDESISVGQACLFRLGYDAHWESGTQLVYQLLQTADHRGGEFSLCSRHVLDKLTKEMRTRRKLIITMPQTFSVSGDVNRKLTCFSATVSELSSKSGLTRVSIHPSIHSTHAREYLPPLSCHPS